MSWKGELERRAHSTSKCYKRNRKVSSILAFRRTEECEAARVQKLLKAKEECDERWRLRKEKEDCAKYYQKVRLHYTLVEMRDHWKLEEERRLDMHRGQVQD